MQKFQLLLILTIFFIPVIKLHSNERSPIYIQLPERGVELNSIKIKSSHALQNSSDFILVRDSIVQQSENWSKHNFLDPQSIKIITKGSKIKLIEPNPWIIKTASNLKAYFFCITPAGKGFVPSDSMLLPGYQDSSTIAGLQLLPEKFTEISVIQLRYYFFCKTGNSEFSIPIHFIENQLEVKMIPDNITIKDADSDGKADFVLSGTLYRFPLDNREGSLSKAEAWISFRQRELCWLYSYETEMMYPANTHYKFRYLKTKNSKGRITKIEKIISTVIENKEQTISWSSADLVNIKPSPVGVERNPVEKTLYFPTAGVVTTDNLRLRNKIGLNSQVLTLLKKGTPVTVVALSTKKEKIDGSEAFWMNIKLGNGKQGWVFGHFINVSAGNG